MIVCGWRKQKRSSPSFVVGAELSGCRATVDRVRRSICFLCDRELTPLSGALGIQQHPQADDCLVDFTDAWGVPIEAPPELDGAERPLQVLEEGEIALQIFPPVDEVLVEIFDELGLPRPGGASSGKGWTNYSIFQRCPYSWRRRYIDHAEPELFGLRLENASRSIGTLVHTFLAMYYARVMDGPFYGFDLDALHGLLHARANPKLVDEGWRLFDSYQRYYQFETVAPDGLIQPLLVEHDVKDPRTGASCRYDLVAFFPDEAPGRMPGTYIVEHKTAQRFDDSTLDGWSNDGEVLGEALWYERLGLAKRYGPLKGVIVNIIGKQKEPKFHRTTVSPSSMLLDDHARSLLQWDGLIGLCRSTGVFPRARGNCINRWGKCEHWEHCSTEES